MARSPLKITIKGVDETLSKLKAKGKDLTDDADMEMSATFVEMVTTAKSIFPNGNPDIKGQTQEYAAIRATIREKKLEPLNYQLIAGRADDDMPAYIEFGTGRYFPNYPGKEKEWQDLARQYYKNGKGWMRPSPYFYPTVKSYLIILVNRLERLFKKDERL